MRRICLGGQIIAFSFLFLCGLQEASSQSPRLLRKVDGDNGGLSSGVIDSK